MTDLLALIIEDEPDLADIFSEAMRSAGFQTETVNRGDVAQRRLRELVPAIIVLDLHLPGVDGSYLLEQIAGDARLANTKIIVATADHIMSTALPMKPDLVLLKPISFSQLRDLSVRLIQIIQPG